MAGGRWDELQGENLGFGFWEAEKRHDLVCAGLQPQQQCSPRHAVLSCAPRQRVETEAPLWPGLVPLAELMELRLG